MEIRAATAADFLVDMLLEAFSWSGALKVTRDGVLSDDHIHRYVDDWPKPGDFGVVAVADGQPIGAAWARTLTSDRPGYGHVADDVPEVSIGVVDSARGQGVGRALLTALVDAARRAGIDRITLSVEPKNPAAHLYRRLGFVVVGRNGGSDTMTLDLAEPADLILR